MRVKPRLHVFGHVHGAHGIFQTNDTTFVNAALLGVHGGIDKAPIVLRMSRR
jgi:Icc-related predicted phosphoesterase